MLTARRREPNEIRAGTQKWRIRGWLLIILALGMGYRDAQQQGFWFTPSTPATQTTDATPPGTELSDPFMDQRPMDAIAQAPDEVRHVLMGTDTLPATKTLGGKLLVQVDVIRHILKCTDPSCGMREEIRASLKHNPGYQTIGDRLNAIAHRGLGSTLALMKRDEGAAAVITIIGVVVCLVFMAIFVIKIIGAFGRLITTFVNGFAIEGIPFVVGLKSLVMFGVFAFVFVRVVDAYRPSITQTIDAYSPVAVSLAAQWFLLFPVALACFWRRTRIQMYEALTFALNQGGSQGRVTGYDLANRLGTTIPRARYVVNCLRRGGMATAETIRTDRGGRHDFEAHIFGQRAGTWGRRLTTAVVIVIAAAALNSLMS